MDFVTAGAHKFHGPKGVGFLYINGDITINPFMHGGAQERNMRAGTENLYGIVGMAKAMEKSDITTLESGQIVGLAKGIESKRIVEIGKETYEYSYSRLYSHAASTANSIGTSFTGAY